MIRTKATIKATKMMLWTETIELETWVNNHEDPTENFVDGLMSIDDSQSGFFPERGTTDGIFVVRQMQEKCLAVDKHIYTAFLAPEKAFNCVP